MDTKNITANLKNTLNLKQIKQTKNSLGSLICGLGFPSMGLRDANKNIRLINVN